MKATIWDWLAIIFVVAIIIYAVYAGKTNTPANNNTNQIPVTITYTNQQFGFSLQYPPGSQLVASDYQGYLPVTQNLASGILLAQTWFAGTNLGEAGVFVGVSSSPNVVSVCEQVDKMSEGETDQGTVMINNQSFHKFIGGGPAAGNLYELTIYRTVKNSKCYEIVEMLHSGNIGNYPTGTVVEFDKPKFAGILEGIAQSFRFVY